MRSAGDILSAAGFVGIGCLRHGLHLDLWWHRDKRMQLFSVQLPGGVLLQGTKAYALTSIAEEGQTWARDIGPLHDYLESHFRSVNLTFSWVRDVPAFLAERQVQRRSGRTASGGGASSDLDRQIQDAERVLAGTQRLRALDSDFRAGSDLLASHLVGLEARQRGNLERLRELRERLQRTEQSQLHLQQEYRRKGSAASLVFSINSNLQVAATEQDLRDAVASIVKELGDAHRFQVNQTLGGRLRIRVTESEEPLVAWIEQWCGGLINPSQLEKLKSQQPAVVESLTRHAAVTPDEDITSEDGNIVDHRKLFAPRVVSALLDRVDTKEALERAQATPRDADRLLHIGLRVEDDRPTDDKHAVSLDDLGHTYISGMTGSGKSVSTRVIIEEIAGIDGVGILVLDPRNQSAGMLLPQDRPDMLARYGRFGMDAPRGFAFGYHAPAIRAVAPLPEDFGQLASGRTIVSFKGLDDAARCGMFQRILDAVFKRLSQTEAARVRLVVVVEEAQLFTRRLVSEDAREHAIAAEAALDRMLREGRKYGLLAIVSSQSIKDFARESAAIRQNTSTKVFFHNSDREIEYARDYLDDPRVLARLKTGVAVLCNPAWGAVQVSIRPPLSKVWDLSDSETAALLKSSPAKRRVVSGPAQALLDAVTGIKRRTGTPPNMSQAAQAARVSSKRRLLALVDELIAAGLATTRLLPVQGQPRVIEPVEPPSTTGSADGHNPDTSGREGAHGSAHPS